jgi:C1A family cysteine protease
MGKPIDPDIVALLMRKFGWIPDIPDPRDYSYDLISTIPKIAAKNIKGTPVVGLDSDLRSHCSAVDDQLRFNSCVLNAATALLEYLDLLSFGRYTELSRMFAYYNCREYQGDVNSDPGTSMRLGCELLAKFGTCPEVEWPYIGINFTRKPPASCYTSALSHKAIRYYRLTNINMEQMLDCLKQGYPFLCGITLFSGWYKAASTGVLNLPDLSVETRLGGHAIMIVGNIANQQVGIGRNSYGTVWGQGGYFTIPYAYLTNSGLCGDLWTIRRS